MPENLWTPKIYNQGRYGSSWGFAIANALDVKSVVEMERREKIIELSVLAGHLILPPSLPIPNRVVRNTVITKADHNALRKRRKQHRQNKKRNRK